MLKHSSKWLVIVNNQQLKQSATKKKKRRFEAFSSSNLESISLENDDIPHVPIVNLERPLGMKAKKERLKKQKCKQGHHDGRKKKNE